MVAVPRRHPATDLSPMIADEAAISVMNPKTTAVRVIPAVGLGVGDMVEFGGLLGRAPVMPLPPQRGGVHRPLRSYSVAGSRFH